MGAAAGLDAADALGRQCALPHQKLGVLLGVDVVGDDRQIDRRPQLAAERIHQRGLAAADRPGDADAKCTSRLCIDAPLLSKKKISLRQRQRLRWLAGQQLAIGTHLIGFGIHLDRRAWRRCESCPLCRCCGSCDTATARFSQLELSSAHRRPAPPATQMSTLVAAVAPPNAPNIGR